MPTGHKKESNVVKIQVEAKPSRAPRRHKHKRRRVLKIKAQKINVPKELTENMVMMQKVMVILAEKLDMLAKQTSDLLRLFEMAAKTFAENPSIAAGSKDKELLDKINQLLEQDKIIARGVIYVEEKVNRIDKDVDKIMSAVRVPQQPQIQASSIPPAAPPVEIPSPSTEEYQTSPAQR